MILSICIPTYNNPDILIENIVLIKKQLSKFQGDFEIVIGDDASTDFTSDICAKYQEKFLQQIRYQRNQNNLGLIQNFVNI